MVNNQISLKEIEQELWNDYAELKGITAGKRLEYAALRVREEMDMGFSLAEETQLEVIKALKEISNKKLQKKSDPELTLAKQAYLKKLDNPKLKSLTENKEVQEFAKEMDRDMERELNLKPTFR